MAERSRPTGRPAVTRPGERARKRSTPPRRADSAAMPDRPPPQRRAHQPRHRRAAVHRRRHRRLPPAEGSTASSASPPAPASRDSSASKTSPDPPLHPGRPSTETGFTERRAARPGQCRASGQPGRRRHLQPAARPACPSPREGSVSRCRRPRQARYAVDTRFSLGNASSTGRSPCTECPDKAHQSPATQP